MSTGKTAPLFEAFKVAGEGDKARWTKVGAVWPTKTGGFIVDLQDEISVSGRIVLQPVKAKEDAPETSAP